jgi:hypothetical protein
MDARGKIVEGGEGMEKEGKNTGRRNCKSE